MLHAILSSKNSSSSEKTLQTEELGLIDRFNRVFRPGKTAPTYGPEYGPLVTDEEASQSSGENDEIEVNPPPAPIKKGIFGFFALLKYPLYISIIIHGMILADLIYAHWRSPLGQYSKGFTTDFDLPRGVLKLEQIRFTHSLRARNGTIYANIDTAGPQYVGTPNEEIDSNWENLIGARYIKLTNGEIKNLNQADQDVANLTPLSHTPGIVDTPGTYGSVDMIHSLHCLNTIRQQFDPEYYSAPEHLNVPLKHYNRMHMKMHIDHCIDHLRQTILCHADLTPVTLRPVDNSNPAGGLVGETERKHTCRSGLEVRKWLTERGESGGYLPPKKVKNGSDGHNHDHDHTHN